jgi:hypothetical protein
VDDDVRDKMNELNLEVQPTEELVNSPGVKAFVLKAKEYYESLKDRPGMVRSSHCVQLYHSNLFSFVQIRKV